MTSDGRDTEHMNGFHPRTGAAAALGYAVCLACTRPQLEQLPASCIAKSCVALDMRCSIPAFA